MLEEFNGNFVNGEITIYKGEFKLVNGEEYLILDGTIFFNFKNRISLEYEGLQVKSSSNFKKFSLEISNDKYDFYITDNHRGSANISQIHLSKNSEPVKGKIHELNYEDDNSIKELKFYIVNFVETHGKINFDYEDYNINLDRIAHRSSYKQIRVESGYMVSHIGTITMRDGGSFKVKEVKSILHDLYWILSFCTGRRVGVLADEGINENGERLWWEKLNSLISPWTSTSTWFPKLNSDILNDLIPKYLELMKNEYLNRVMRELTSWYLEAVSSNSIIENKIVSIVIALETLAWSYLVQEKQIITEEKFNKNYTAQNIKKLLQVFNIDNDITKFEGLNRLQDSPSGTRLLIDERNSIVHPINRSSSVRNVDDKLAIYSLGLYYLELSILALFKYDKVYTNRMRFPDLWEGDYDVVPWVEVENT